MTLEQKIENITGNLRDAYKQAVPGTLLHVDELMRERITNLELRNLWFYTPDGAVDSMDGKTPTLRITREAVNPILKNIDGAFGQLVNTGNYNVLPADFEAVKAAVDTVTINLTKLGLQGNNDEWGYLAVDTSKAITKYNAEAQKLLRRVFGPTDDDYTANMEMLRESPQRIKETRVYVLNPNYVKKHAKESPIARACWLNDFYDYSSFIADVRDVDYHDAALRGVRASDSELQGTAGAPKNEVPSDSQEMREVIAPTMEEILALSRPYVSQFGWEQWQQDLQKKFN
ncbi:MAG: hypothetical protein AABW48_06170 [Nanoarchaeota archaeon]|mgnify:CR=1 FL=1